MTRGKHNTKKPTQKLASREIEVLTLIAQGKMRGDISAILSLSEETVKNYIARACRKLNAVNKTHAIAIAMLSGLISPFENAEDSKHEKITGNCQQEVSLKHERGRRKKRQKKL